MQAGQADILVTLNISGNSYNNPAFRAREFKLTPLPNWVPGSRSDKMIEIKFEDTQCFQAISKYYLEEGRGERGHIKISIAFAQLEDEPFPYEIDNVALSEYYPTSVMIIANSYRLEKHCEFQLKKLEKLANMPKTTSRFKQIIMEEDLLINE